MPEPVAADSSRYADHLEAVSRSFAPCIAQLTLPLRDWVGLSYLLCRVLDTVEDAPWADLKQQQQQFLAFDTFVRASPNPAAIKAWVKCFPQAIPAGEARLLQDAPQLLADLHALPKKILRSARRVLLQMSAGMRRFAQMRDQHNALRLRDLAEVNRYCYVVAGIVGSLLTELLAHAHPQYRRNKQVARDAVHFGLFLQKINLLKDQQQDETEGRFFLPDRAGALRSLRGHAEGAGRYLLALPPNALAFRQFCAWSLFLGAQSLPLLLATDTPKQEAPRKLPRAQTQALFAEVAELCRNQAQLAQALKQALQQLPGPSHSAASANSAAATHSKRWLHCLPGHPWPSPYAIAPLLP